MKPTQYATAAFSALTAVFFLTFVGLVFAAPGDLDPSFSEDGKLIDFLPGGGSDTLPHTARGIAIQPDGKIIVVGYRGNSSNSDFLIFRYMPDGLPDNSFDADGKVLISFSSEHDRAYAVALQSDGKIVVTGSSVNQFNIDFAVMRLNPDGSLDTTFDGDEK